MSYVIVTHYQNTFPLSLHDMLLHNICYDSRSEHGVWYLGTDVYRSQTHRWYEWISVLYQYDI